LGEPKNIGDAFAAIPISAMSDWTDEQWAEHDARVAADRAPSVLPVLARTPLEDLGWPARALSEARAADLTRPAVARMLAHDFDKHNVVVLSGAAGCGKTVGAARWAMDRHKRATFVRASTFAAGSRYNAEQREAWYEAQALVLDDLGAEYLDAKGSFLVDLDELVDTYYGGMRPLVITTNCTGKQFQERYGARVWDRLRECAKWISVAGESLRRSP
jgi:DNA replication protein DnaC